ncbi:MAG: hypothetical protein RMA76_26890 [Deltaproteobacteria bacterium]
MSATSPTTGDLIGKRATAAIHSIEDASLRERVLRAVVICDDALETVDALDLAPYELDDDGSPDLSVWEALAPDIRNILVAVRNTSEELAMLFPPSETPEPDDFDFELVLDEDGLPEPIRDTRDIELDALVEGNPNEEVGASIAVLASMLRSDIVQFGTRLRNPRVTADRWFLLGELQEMRSKCSQCLTAIVASIISAFTEADVAEVLPRYASATARAIKLRTRVVDLSFDVNRLNTALAGSGVAQASAVRTALAMRLNEFEKSEAYPELRPQDKRLLIDFRNKLASYRDISAQRMELVRDAEGLSKFLEVMRAINQREVLIASDKSRLQTIRMLLESEVDLDEVQEHLEAIYGRWPAIDDFVRLGRKGRYAAAEDVLPIVLEAQESLRD